MLHRLWGPQIIRELAVLVASLVATQHQRIHFVVGAGELKQSFSAGIGQE